METGEEQLGTGHEILIKINVMKFCKGIIFLPTSALVVCIGLSITCDLEESTATHCKVDNYLPSISATIGGFIPQKFIWQIAIALHTAPRIFITFLTKKYYLTFSTNSQSVNRRFLIHLMAVVELTEVLSLLFLTIVTSSDAYAWHEKSFITFVVCSQVNMLLKIAIFVSLKHDSDFSNTMARSLSAKVKLWLSNLIAIILAGHFFLQHNTYCESGVYTLFALSEYAVVLSNIAYHATILYEFPDNFAVVELESYERKKSP